MNDATSHDAKLHELAARIGEQAAARLDVERTAQAVVARLRERSSAVTPAWARPAWWRIAAAVVVLLGGGLIGRGMLDRPRTTDHYVAEDLTGLSADDLRQILSSLDEMLTPNPVTGADAGLDDLNERQLREVLRSLEG